MEKIQEHLIHGALLDGIGNWFDLLIVAASNFESAVDYAEEMQLSVQAPLDRVDWLTIRMLALVHEGPPAPQDMDGLLITLSPAVREGPELGEKFWEPAHELNALLASAAKSSPP